MKKKNKVITIILFILLLGVVLCISNKDFIEQKINLFFGEEIEVLGSKFGTVTGYRGNVPKLEETGTIILENNVHFGWVIATKTIDKNIAWKEVIIFPERPKDLIVTVATKVSEDGKKAITEKSSNLKDGLLYNSWALTESDPLGEYKIKVYGEEKLLQEFKFKVKK